MQKNQKLSDDFIEAFRSGTGSIRGTCEWCGREFFEDNRHAGDWDEGELEKLRERAAIDDKIVAMDTVSFGHIDGKQFVMGCPCLASNIGKYEGFVWNHRKQIAEYIQKRVKTLVEQVLRDEAAVEHTKDSLEQEKRAEERMLCQYCGKEYSKIGFDEENARCILCGDKLKRLMLEASAEMPEEDYDKLAKQIGELGGFAPGWNRPRDDEDDNLPF